MLKLFPYPLHHGFDRRNWSTPGTQATIYAACILAGIVMFAVPGMAEEPVLLDDVVVTARKIEEDPKNIPQSITVFSSDGIERGGISHINDLYQLAPSMDFLNNHAMEGPVLMRGVGNFATGEPSIGFYQDGSYLNADSYWTRNLYDIKRIEVLKGPQATLYGKSAIGGVVNVITKKPSNKVETGASYIYGDGNRHRVAGYVSGPLVKDKLLYRRHRGLRGHYTNTFDGESIDHSREKSIRMTMVARPTSDLEVTPSLTLLKQSLRGYPYRRTSGDEDYDGQPYSRNHASYASMNQVNASLKILYDWDDYEFTSLTAWNSNDEAYASDLDHSSTASILGEKDVERTDFSQELRVAYQGDGPLSWITGLYYFNLDDDYSSVIAALASTDKTVTRSETYSAFGQMDYKVTDKLTLTGGLRFDHDPRTQVGPGVAKSQKYFHHFTPKAAASYAFTPDLLVYGSYTSSHKPGGFNSANYPDFDKEESDAYEIGFKSKWEKWLTVNGAAFLTKLKNQQVYELDGTLEITSNTGNSEIKRAEVDLTWQVTPNFVLSAGATYIDARFTEYLANRTGPQGNRTYSLGGNRLVWIPEYSATLRGDYSRTIGNHMGMEVKALGRVELMAWGEKQWDEFNTRSQEPYQVVNISVGLEVGSARLRAFVDNVFDAGYFVWLSPDYAFPFFSGADLAARGQERRFGLQWDMAF